MVHRSLRSSMIMLAVIMLAIAGCGESMRLLTRAELLAGANAICRRVIDEVDWRKTPPYRLVLLSRRLGKLETQASVELAKFKPPGGISAYWQVMVDDFQLTGQEFEQLANIQTKISAQEAFYVIEPVLNAMRERAAVAHASGLKDCAKY